MAIATMALALHMHAAVNVLNDHHDAMNDADGVNTQGFSPFTGSARLIQNGHVTLDDTRPLAYALVLLFKYRKQPERLMSTIVLAMAAGLLSLSFN